jgi:uncharacterized protein YndB with AHSA1/START domain
VATPVAETMAGTYRLSSRWELEATPREVFDLIADASSYPRWWPSVFLDARILEPGNDQGVGRLVEVRTAAFLLFTLRWRYRVTSVRASEGMAVETSGDLDGVGVWSFEPSDSHVVVRFNWRGGVTRSPFRQLPTFLRPLFRACYRWAMERGFTSLLLEVWRRRTDDQEARDWLPRPPGPAFPRNLRPWRPTGAGPQVSAGPRVV